MKNMISVVIALLASTPVIAQTQVPHTFEAGQPARAADVNANFDALETVIDQSISSLSNIEATTKRWDQGCINYDDDFWRNDGVGVGHDSRVEAGTEITVAGETFTYAKVPFVEHSSGVPYNIWVPMRNNELQIFTTHDPDPLPCSDQQFVSMQDSSGNNIGNLPVRVITTETRSIRINGNGAPAQSIISIDVVAFIKLDDTVIIIDTPSLSAVETEGVPSGTCCDLSSVLDTGMMAHPDELVSEIEKLAVIRIESAPQ